MPLGWSFPAFLRTPTFRLTALSSAILAALTAVLFAFIFWQTALVEMQRVDHVLEREAEVMAKSDPRLMQQMVERRVVDDFHHIAYAALFDAGQHGLSGNLQQFPAGLRVDGHAHRMDLKLLTPDRTILETGRMVGRRLADGRFLVIGRNVDSLDDLENAVLRALKLGVIPAVALILLGGTVLSYKAHQEFQELHHAAESIARGEIWQRLPTRGGRDDLNRLVATVNQMLDGIGQTLDEVKYTSDSIAHDLRTPLTRVRAHLQMAQESAAGDEELQTLVERAIAGLDQSLRIISSLLRLGQIESGKRRAAFAFVDLSAVMEELAEFYGPIAESRQITLTTALAAVPAVWGDRDLLMEAVGNLLDNAVKFTPPGGAVRLGLETFPEGGAVIRVADSGPGIAPEERAAVLRRFYRSGKTRHLQGCGLGLSLVDAIVRLHGFSLVIGDADPGCVIELVCRGGTG